MCCRFSNLWNEPIPCNTSNKIGFHSVLVDWIAPWAANTITPTVNSTDRGENFHRFTASAKIRQYIRKNSRLLHCAQIYCDASSTWIFGGSQTRYWFIFTNSIQFETYFDGAVEKISSNSIGRNAPSCETKIKSGQPSCEDVQNMQKGITRKNWSKACHAHYHPALKTAYDRSTGHKVEAITEISNFHTPSWSNAENTPFK